jgi:hypothetical protein
VPVVAAGGAGDAGGPVAEGPVEVSLTMGLPALDLAIITWRFLQLYSNNNQPFPFLFFVPFSHFAHHALTLKFLSQSPFSRQRRVESVDWGVLSAPLAPR